MEAIISKVKIESSNLEAIGYDTASKTLQVEFKNESVYNYLEVPEEVYQAFLLAKEDKRYESFGKFFDKEIKKAGFQYAKVKDGVKKSKAGGGK